MVMPFPVSIAMTAVCETRPVYRYEFNNPTIDLLTAFVKLHANDDRRTYREAWGAWWQVNVEALELESRRLQNLGYEGDVQDKMYKAGRYYFRTKTPNKPDPRNRRAYIWMSPAVLDAMDQHIGSVAGGGDFTPAKGYDWFCATHTALLRTEIVRLRNTGRLTAEDLVAKVKQTYKNRCFLHRD